VSRRFRYSYSFDYSASSTVAKVTIVLLEAHNGPMEACYGTMKAHHGAVEAHHGTTKAHHGAMERLFFLFHVSDTAVTKYTLIQALVP
jgi:hypothetical protein